MIQERTLLLSQAPGTQHQTPGTALRSRLDARTASVAIVGLGYVGLPLAVAFADAGFPVMGVDVDARKVGALRAGRSPVGDVTDERVAALVATDRLRPTTSFEALAACDCIVACVPTPLGKTREPDISAIIQATDEIAARLRPGQLIVLESTTYPGTTEEILLPRLGESGLSVGRDYFLAFSPERIDPGNQAFGVRNIPKVVGGVTEACTQIAREFYATVVERVYAVSSARVAEMTKLLENTFRSVNIALVNELALMCHHLNVDAWEVIHAADTKPFAFMAHYPGPGIGGHCIPLDPHYLTWKARLAGYEPRLIALASEINAAMPRHVVELVSLALNRHRKCINGSRILILGVAYKPGVADTREAPARAILSDLMDRGALVSYNDPFVPRFTVAGRNFASCELTDEALSSADCVLIVTDHRGYDWDRVVHLAPLVVDTRNSTRGIPMNGSTLVKL
jgi:UDP-N-acetyl-D-glucosamine dehydrogenase